MNRAIAEKLTKLAEDAGGIDEEYLAERWAVRVKSFLATAVGDEEAKHFADLEGSVWPHTLAMKLGYLEGLIALIEAPADLKAQLSPLSKPVSQQSRPDSRRVFIVHGHDDPAKESAARFVERLGLEAVVLHEQPNAGRTVIEKFETYSEDIAFAVVLLTPDDLGNKVGDKSILNPRARQNVIMELGYFIGRLGRTRVCAIHKGGVELPSDYQGVLYIEMDAAGAWKTRLAQEFVQAKVPIELTGLLGG